MHVDGKSFLLDDYRALTGFGVAAHLNTKKQEKGHYEELIAFHQVIAGSLDRGAVWHEAIEVTRTAFEIDRQVRAAQRLPDVTLPANYASQE